MFRENQAVQLFYFKTVRFISVMSFGPLYKNINQVFMIFGSNYKTKKSLVYLIPFFLLAGIFLSGYQLVHTNIPYLVGVGLGKDTSRLLTGYYADGNKENDFLLGPEIETEKVEAEVIKLFIPIYRHESDMKENICETVPLDSALYESDESKATRARALACYHTYNRVYLNGELQDVVFRRENHPRTKQFGLVGFVDLSGIRRGVNEITVAKNYGEEENAREWTVPFYYLVHEH
jgi:hypothetical protein